MQVKPLTPRARARCEAQHACTCHEGKRLLLGAHVRQQLHEDDVLQDIGVVAGVEAVAIAEQALPRVMELCPRICG